MPRHLRRLVRYLGIRLDMSISRMQRESLGKMPNFIISIPSWNLNWHLMIFVLYSVLAEG